MSIKAKISKEAMEQAQQLKVHFIPASIDGNGPIKINEYFTSYTETANGGKKLNINRACYYFIIKFNFSAHQRSTRLSIERRRLKAARESSRSRLERK